MRPISGQGTSITYAGGTPPSSWETEISQYRSAKSPRPNPIAATWNRLVRILTNPIKTEETEKTNLPAWSPTRYRSGAQRRQSAAIESLTCLVLDVDDGSQMKETLGAWEGHSVIVHSTVSHTPETPKYRVVLPFEEPIPSSYWPRVHSWAIQRTPGTDPICKDPSRIYFLPSFLKGQTTENFVSGVEWTGKLLNIDYTSLPETPEETMRREIMDRIYSEEEARDSWLLSKPMEKFELDEETLKYNVKARISAAQHLKAVIVGGPNPRAEGIRCPKCKNQSVWFFLAPGKMAGARCKHQHSCGWSGWLDFLVHMRY